MSRRRRVTVVLLELIDRVERRFREATNPQVRWKLGWVSVRLLAESGDLEAAEARAGELEITGSPEGTYAPTADTDFRKFDFLDVRKPLE